MRVGRRKWGFVIALVLALGTMSPLGASTFVQRCDGPPPSTQAGRATFSPGVNRLSVAQQIAFKVSLFDCSPARATRGAGSLRTMITPKGSQTCALLTAPKVYKTTSKVTWKDEKVSTIAMTYSFTGSSQFINIKGKVTAGLFQGHSVTGQFKFKSVVTPLGNYPNGDGVSQACVNKIAPQKFGRIAITAINLYTTKHFVIT